jgi:hypothetical protein
VSKSLGAPAHLRPVALMPLGYAAETPERPPRRPLDQLVQSERWDVLVSGFRRPTCG